MISVYEEIKDIVLNLRESNERITRETEKQIAFGVVDRASIQYFVASYG